MGQMMQETTQAQEASEGTKRRESQDEEGGFFTICLPSCFKTVSLCKGAKLRARDRLNIAKVSCYDNHPSFYDVQLFQAKTRTKGCCTESVYCHRWLHCYERFGAVLQEGTSGGNHWEAGSLHKRYIMLRDATTCRFIWAELGRIDGKEGWFESRYVLTVIEFTGEGKRVQVCEMVYQVLTLSFWLTVHWTGRTRHQNDWGDYYWSSEYPSYRCCSRTKAESRAATQEIQSGGYKALDISIIRHKAFVRRRS